MKWKAIMKKASQNGLHKRWYARNRDKKLRTRYEYELKRNPLYGIQRITRDAKNGKESIDALINRLGEALIRIEQESSERRPKPKERKCGL